MRDLNAVIGDIRLTQLKIPATHNSGAFSIDLIKRVKCQYHSIGEQLNLGIRYFDIRLKEIYTTRRIPFMKWGITVKTFLEISFAAPASLSLTISMQCLWTLPTVAHPRISSI